MAHADVLVVDDSKVFRDLVRTLLATEGFSVRTAVDGADALRQLADAPPDALILDLKMPNGDGVTVLRERRERNLAADAYVVVLTADDDPNRPAELEPLGASTYVTKPFDADRFIAGLRDHMHARRARAQKRAATSD